MKNYLIALGLSFGLILSSCAVQTGSSFLNEMSQEEVSSFLIVNKTTKEDVKSKFGEPESIVQQKKGKEEWNYSFKQSEIKPATYIPIYNNTHGGTYDVRKRLKVWFNSKGLVEDFKFINTKGETKMGVIFKEECEKDSSKAECKKEKAGDAE